MKKKIIINNKSKANINKKTENVNKNKKSNSMSHTFLNMPNNRNKILIIINFLDINEQLPLLKLNSVLAKIIINKYNLPFKSKELLKEIKNNKNSNEAKYTKIYFNFNNIIKNNDILENEYQFIQSYLLKNIKNNFLIFDSLGEENATSNEKDIGSNDTLLKKYKIFIEFLEKIKFINNITHIKFKISNLDDQIKDNHLNKENFNILYFSNFFKNINHLEIDTVMNSLCFMNSLISYPKNSISNVNKINLINLNIKRSNEEIIGYDIYNSLSFPELNNLKYLFLVKVNLSIFCLNEIISKNLNLVKLVILQCSNNNINLYDEKEYSKLLNKSINNCKELNYVEFNNNNFGIYLTNQIVYILIEVFFKLNKINLIYCGYPNNTDKNNKENDDQNNTFEFPKCLKECIDLINKEDFNKYLTIKFNPSLSYRVKKNKRIIDISNYLQNEKIINEINYEKIKLTLYISDSPSISNNIKKIMQNYYKKDITKYLQIFCSFKNGELSPMVSKKSKNEVYKSIEKVTIYFQNEESIIPLFGSRIISSILEFFPCVKIISFKNIDFKNDNKIFREYFDDINESLELVLFGEKNKDFSLFKNKECCLKEIRFNNCYFYNHFIEKDITQEIEIKIEAYLGKNAIRVIYVD